MSFGKIQNQWRFSLSMRLIHPTGQKYPQLSWLYPFNYGTVPQEGGGVGGLGSKSTSMYVCLCPNICNSTTSMYEIDFNAITYFYVYLALRIEKTCVSCKIYQK